MRVISILLSFVATLSAIAQTIEIVNPVLLDAEHTGAWTVIVSNPGPQPTLPADLNVHFTPGGVDAAIISVPPGCQTVNVRDTVCPAIAIAPGESRVYEYRLRLAGPYGVVYTSARYGNFGPGASSTAVFGRPLTVTNTNDDGPGSLRQVIAEMNQTCIPSDPCQPVFRIDGPVPAEGWFTIRPLSPLPPVTARFVVMDGRTQAVHTGDTNPAGPEIMLDGSFTGSGHGLQFDGGAVTVTDLAVGNFPGNGIASAADTTIRRCHLGMDPSGVRRAPNGTRGVQVEHGTMEITDNLLGGNFRSGGWFDSRKNVTVARNRFIDNGASGFYAKTPPPEPGGFNTITVENNIITGNAHAGISLDRESTGNYAKNHFGGNLGRAIDIGIDGETFAMIPALPGRGGVIGVPAITTARYENGETILVARSAPRNPMNIYLTETVYFYAGRDRKDGGELLGFTDASVRGGETFTLRVPRDLRGQWVSAATFVMYIYNWDDKAPGTSEAGVPRLVE
jgi:hypothetical protein